MKRVVFLSPIGKGGPYFVYQDIVKYFQKKYAGELEVIFTHSIKDWITLHFSKNDIVFSVIPFLFKPLRTGEYIYNPRGDFEKEKKEKGLGKKLLYLSKINLYFSDGIWLVSYFLADKLGFKEKYKDKIQIFPNFIDSSTSSSDLEKVYNDSSFRILTVTSFSFYEKGKGILNLAKVIQQLGKNIDGKISWTIIGNDGSKNFHNIKKEFDLILFSKNVSIEWKGWCKKEEIQYAMNTHDYFLYWTYLDNFPNVLLQALSYDMNVLSNSYQSFGYFLSANILCNSEQEMLTKLLSGERFTQNIKEYSKEVVCDDIYNFIIRK